MQKTERVELLVANKPGVLGRVAGHIRHEGWNIKRLMVDEFNAADSGAADSGAADSGAAGDHAGMSRMEIDIEGTHTKLARVMDRLLNLDCVISISMIQDGKKAVRSRPREKAPPKAELEQTLRAPAKKDGCFRILAVNPGSTSTKFGIYDDEACILFKKIEHDPAQLARLGAVLEQKELRRDCIMKSLEGADIPLSSLDAVAGRGGLLKPIESGTYGIGKKMLEDLHSATAAIHASALGAIIAAEIADPLSIPAYVVDPIVVDEMDRNAKLTGMPGVERSSVFHALNQKAIARRLAAELGMAYENARFIVAHLGGGITVGAHRYGRVIDVNDALSGEGPFTPERTGAIPVIPVIDMCFSGEYTEEEMIERITKRGGMRAYLGTGDIRIVQKMINDGDEFAALVLDSMAYQVSKEIGAMTAVLEGLVDAIILTGGLAHSTRFTGAIKQRVDKLAPVHVFPGEDEMIALVEGVLRVLRGKEQAARYE
ncbi:MAG: butyrate kinase [Spirochaetaceae bacterium]|jgi:butyrate kinase|nr:butyrate kinase [Spirochaetaceae bacterium]